MEKNHEIETTIGNKYHNDDNKNCSTLINDYSHII
jgi:hypothetical protein